LLKKFSFVRSSPLSRDFLSSLEKKLNIGNLLMVAQFCESSGAW
jgi:hypothetical protein